MRSPFLSLVLALPLLVACQLALPGGKEEAVAATGAVDEITATPLDGPAVPVATATPKAVEDATPVKAATAPQMTSTELAETAKAPGADETKAAIDAAAAAAAPPPPAPVKSPSQIACEKKGGQFAPAGKGNVFVCVNRTRDGGKRCSKESDCQGLCLARSRSCSPFTPVFGCQEILQQDGKVVTQCLNLN